ncbi:hypothetical protein F3Y22_tig00110206pilonHSYRG00336 [Hibiscus syriacus]|uniref:GDSL esterase/lipase n=1 Tax=Hibiscus syriacus TaxID=106335 RepID=A0A6A3B9F7_HIBSY|nr:hypothetical protein F3Y22_tig00110206pilonHSYRG00336 [Hibiscus syriacus]
MYRRNFSFFFFFLLMVCVWSWRMEFPEAQMVPAVYVLGDSLVDVGNNDHLPVSFAKANFPPNGVDFPTKKPTGRFCNGKNAADLIVHRPISLSDTNNASFINGVSFASGGAGIFNGTDRILEKYSPTIRGLDGQHLKELLKRLYEFGARKFFLAGFSEIKSACCGLGDLRAEVACVPISRYCSNRKNHVFWDLYHPTEATVRIFVDTFDGSSPVCVPMNLRQLVSA